MLIGRLLISPIFKIFTRSIFVVAWLAISFSMASAQQEQILNAEPIITRLDNARSVFITPFSNIYIVETGRHRLLKCSLDGTRLDSLGNRGFGKYHLNRPLDVDATNGLKVFVTDFNNRRIQIYDRRMQFLSSIERPPRDRFQSRYAPMQVASNSLGELFFYDDEGRHIVKYSESGEWSTSFGSYGSDIQFPPADLTSSEEQLLVADSVNQVIHVLSNVGRYQQFIALPDSFKPLGMSADSQKIHVLGKQRIVQLSSKGRLEQEYKLPSHLEQLRDIERAGNSYYLLSATTLYKLKIR